MKYLDTEVRPMTDEDLDMVLEIENQCFVDPWKKEDILYEKNNNPYSNFMVVELSNDSLGIRQVCGFCDYWITFDSATICQIAIHKELQHMGIGSELMKDLIDTCRAKKVKTITLEVRAGNINAINFYLKFGFRKSHVKEKYYLNGEDAIYMIREVEG